jgi:hypothetical protein
MLRFNIIIPWPSQNFIDQFCQTNKTGIQYLTHFGFELTALSEETESCLGVSMRIKMISHAK